MRTASALRRNMEASANNFPNDVVELQALLGPVGENQGLIAIPGADSNVPIWLLGSSHFSAHLAGMLGLPFAFASHFAPDAMDEAVAIYRREFRPSARLSQPYVILALNVVASASEAESRRLFTTQQQSFVNLRRGRPGLIPPPLDDIEAFWEPHEKSGVERALACTVLGDPAQVAEGLKAFAARHRPDEMLVTANIFEHRARLRSFELAMQAWTEANR